MNVSAIVLVAWIPACVALFAAFQPVRACTLCFTLGWLLLPMAQVDIPGFFNLDKVLSTNAGVMLGALLFCPGRFRGFRPGVAGLMLVAFACSAAFTSVVNDLGAYDGVSTAARMMLYYGVPYFFGRAFLRTRRDLIEACHIVVGAAMLYAIPAIWEWRMSPQLHAQIYGFFQHEFAQTHRWGSFRPLVFFYSPLALGTFFVWTSLLATWLYLQKRLRPVFGVPPLVLVAMCLAGLLVSMSLGPYLMFSAGLGLLFIWQRWRWRRIILLPAIFSIAWMGGRYFGRTDGAWLTSAAAAISPARAYSLQYRIDAEVLVLAKARKRPGFGWGGWGRDRVLDNRGRAVKAVDGLWLTFASGYGLMGLSLFFIWWCWPLVLSAAPGGRAVHEPAIMALLVAITLQAANFMFNGFLSPVLTLMAGSVVVMFSNASLYSSSSSPRQEAAVELGHDVHWAV